MKWAALILLFLYSILASAQDYSERQSFDPNVKTGATSVSSDKKKDAPVADEFPEKLEYFIINDPQKVLYGNPCVEEVTHSLGFRYMLVPMTKIDGYIDEDPVWHNFKTHVKLIFKNGPFYKSKVRKAIKTCAVSSGDFVG